ncbi:peptidoglycan editing factor PgeF [Teredinibacter sp. KSP-S5-2]|uniref:peptidoglycan editing factor PgeF n=1 Tax=Teredinibacter sp. KSP-S5-2 TaxID=3034506 RepID=UPI002934341D|nr:peptidoglycan editing factor PgeF [Teredinibacter sp. KSP-S5-2]WNO09872.1 peptidoglycan editing factor PgeF [Teredinibacter sp. KSP-S5-2]
MNNKDVAYIKPEWPAPENVRALITTRSGGVSKEKYASFNLAAHVGDDIDCVEENRKQLYEYIGYPVSWLQQTHSTDVITLDEYIPTPTEGDATFTGKTGVVCSVLTADCLPLLVTDKGGEQVAAIHAGWRGLADGIVTETIKCFQAPAKDLLVYLGPAISKPSFEVGLDVLYAFQQGQKSRSFAENIESSFTPKEGEKDIYFADIYRLARSELNGLDVEEIYGGEFCSYLDNERFFSFRRDVETGRMASLIWKQ